MSERASVRFPDLGAGGRERWSLINIVGVSRGNGYITATCKYKVRYTVIGTEGKEGGLLIWRRRVGGIGSCWGWMGFAGGEGGDVAGA